LFIRRALALQASQALLAPKLQSAIAAMGGVAQIGGQTLGAINNLRSQGVPSVLTPEATMALGALASATSNLGAALQAIQSVLPTTPGAPAPAPAVLQPLVSNAETLATQTLTAARALVVFVPEGTLKSALSSNINTQENLFTNAILQLSAAYTVVQQNLQIALGARSYCGSKCDFLAGTATLPGAQTLRGRVNDGISKESAQWEQLMQPVFDVVVSGL
jgi:hypothetical protein